MSDRPFHCPVWVRGDLDGFFGLMVDNLVQVLLIVSLCQFVAGLPPELIYQRILPGVAVSLLIGNLFYGVQARRAARRTGNTGYTALPYGINTPSVFAFVLFVMAPVHAAAMAGGMAAADAGDLAWKAGLFACLVSGLIEFFGAFVAERLRRVTPRAALLGVLAAVGITFIAADFAFRIYTRPLVGILPLALLLLAYFARFRFPFGIPGGFLALLFGTAVAWGATVMGWHEFGAVKMDPSAVSAAVGQVRWSPPHFVGGELFALLRSRPELLFGYLAVSIPMGYLNVLGSLQNIESAEACGDRFATAPSLAVNGLGTIAAGLFGSCFPTTIYIGHPGWKALGARTGYSVLNGLFFTVFFLCGLGPLLSALIPIEAGAAIVMYIGIIITAQAFQTTPREHAPAVAIALFPALAGLLVITVSNYLEAAGAVRTLSDLIAQPTPATAYLPGLLALTGANSGWIIVTLILTAIGAALIDRKYKAAAVWAAIAAALTAIGAIHAYRLVGNVLHPCFLWQHWQPVADAPAVVLERALPIAVGYALAAITFALAATRTDRSSPASTEDN